MLKTLKNYLIESSSFQETLNTHDHGYSKLSQMRDMRVNKRHSKMPSAETTSFPYCMLDDSYFFLINAHKVYGREKVFQNGFVRKREN